MSQPKIKLPVRPRNYRFAMTPLADAMFQLLIFFMLTSSLLTVQTAAPPPEQVTATSAPTPNDKTPTPPLEVALWTLEAERIIVGGQEFTFDSLDALADALGSDVAPADVTILVRDTARVQDVTTVLARLATANVGAVRVARGAI